MKAYSFKTNLDIFLYISTIFANEYTSFWNFEISADWRTTDPREASSMLCYLINILLELLL